jgi:hypothetical protein
MGMRFISRAFVASLLGACGAGGAQAAVMIDWFQDPSGLLPYGQGIEFTAYSASTASNVATSFISLDFNDFSKHTVIASSTGGTYDQGAPLATLTSTNAGESSNTLTAYTFSPGPDEPFNILRGAYFLSTIDSASSSTTITVTVNYFDVTTDSDGTQTHTFTVDTPRVGRIGFGPDFSGDDYHITSMTFALPIGEAAWNTIDNLVFAVPETSTWASMGLGFIGLGFVGYRRSAVSEGRSLLRRAVRAAPKTPPSSFISLGSECIEAAGVGAA